MLILLLLQSMLLLGLAALVVFWRLQTLRSLAQISSSDAERATSLRNLQTVLSEFQAEFAELQKREQRPAEIAQPSPNPSPSLSLGKRSQALKMIRRGESIETIAAAVGAPQSQIRLLKKVHALIDVA